MSEKKILYIYNKPLEQLAGGDRVNIRNLELLKSTGHKISAYQITLPKANRIKTLLRMAKGYCLGIRSSVIRDIISTVGKESIDCVFLCSSKIGILSKIISRIYPDIKIIIFFHNIEKQYGRELLKSSNSIQNKFINSVINRNERCATIYGDAFVTMNSRDSNLLNDYYGKQSDLLLPLGFTDSYGKNSPLSKFRDVEEKTRLLFVGSAFFANVNGLNWFIDNVYPHLNNVELKIVGKGMDACFKASYDASTNSSIVVNGYVDDLTAVYENAHIVVSPIFDGGGMKTKTAEAMMYGCPIVGTDEAFRGYDVDYDKIGAKCNTTNEFIDAIKRLAASKETLPDKANSSRTYFLKYYETSALVDRIQSFIERI